MRNLSLIPAVRRLLRWQALVVVVAVCIAYALGGEPAARSALLGGLTAFLPNIYFALRAGVTRYDKTAKEIVRSFYIGESVKLVLTALMFWAVLRLPDISFMPLIATFVAVLTVFRFALLDNKPLKNRDHGY